MNEFIDVPPTAEEIKEQRDNSLNATHPASWVWNEEKVSWVAPIDPPTDGFPYLWDEATLSWIPFPDYPVAGDLVWATVPVENRDNDYQPIAWSNLTFNGDEYIKDATRKAIYESLKTTAFIDSTDI